MNQTMHIIESVKVVASSKDSLKVHWNIYDHYVPIIRSYQIQYQAIGSRFIQFTGSISASNGDYEIKELHENTHYNICVKVFTNSTPGTHDHCVHATTSINSLSVALGSTFGAFLALGIIVMFVFIAKWQHNGTLSRKLEKMRKGRDKSYDTMPYSNGDIELSEISYQVSSENKTTQIVLLGTNQQYTAYEPTQMEVTADVCQGQLDELTDSQNNSIKMYPSSINPQPSTSGLPHPKIHKSRSPRSIDPRLLIIKGYSVDTGPLQSERTFGTSPNQIHAPIRHNNSCNF